MGIDFKKEYKISFKDKENGLTIDLTEIGDTSIDRQIDLIIIESAPNSNILFDVSSNTKEPFVLRMVNSDEPIAFDVWDDGFKTKNVFNEGEYGLYITELSSGLESSVQNVVIKGESVTEGTYCKEGPVLFGDNPLTNVTKDGLFFRFHGVDIQSIAWRVSKNGNVIDNGVVFPSSSNVEVTFSKALTSGRYYFVIEGNSCISQPSGFFFEINEDEKPIPPIDVSDDFSFDEVDGLGENLRGDKLSLSGTNMRFSADRGRNRKLLKGFNYSPIAAISNPKGEWEKYKGWDQGFYLSSSDKNNIVKQDNLTYYFAPSGYKSDLNTPLYDFWRLFPKFSLPNGKMIVLESGKGIRSRYNDRFDTSDGYGDLVFDLNAHNNMLDRGITHLRGMEGTKPANSMKFLGDAWIEDVGYPKDGWTPAPDHEERVLRWSLEYSPKRVFDYWKIVHFGDPNGTEYLGNTSYYLWDYEKPWAWIYTNPSHFHEFMDLVTDFAEREYPNLKISVWRYAGVKLRNVDHRYNYYNDFVNLYENKVGDALAYLKNSDLAKQGGLRFYDALIGTKCVQQVHFYQSYLNGKENPLLYMMEYVYNKRTSPDALSLLIYWSDIETVEGGDFGTEFKRFDVDGNARSFGIKPRVGNDTMQTFGFWSIAFGDGADLWEIVRWNDDKKEWNFTDRVVGNVLPNSYPYTPVKNIDDFMKGVWAATANKDIIEAETKWNFVKNDAFVFYSNNSRQAPLIGWKLSNDRKEALVAISDFSCIEVDGFNTWNVDILGKTYAIKTHGRFTSVVRVVL